MKIWGRILSLVLMAGLFAAFSIGSTADAGAQTISDGIAPQHAVLGAKPPISSDLNVEGSVKIDYINNYWGVSDLTIQYWTTAGGFDVLDTGPLAVHGNRSFVVPDDVYQAKVDVYLNGSFSATKSFYLSDLFSKRGASFSIRSAGTVFNPSVWMVQDK